MGRVKPCKAIRAICAEFSAGNMCAAFALVRGVKRPVSVNTSGTLDRVCERNIDPPNFTLNVHAVGPERILGRTPQYRSRPHVELSSVQWARHRRAVERALRQWSLPVRAH